MDGPSTGVQNYLNTLIFCIIAKGVSIVILVLLIFDFAQPYAYMLLTIEIVLIVIIIVSMYKIVSYEKRLAAEVQSKMTGTHSISVCPDYFVKNYDGATTTCNNSYTTPDGNYTYTMGNATVTATTVNLDTIDHQGQAKLAEICDTISGTDYGSFAWTDLKPKCNISV